MKKTIFIFLFFFNCLNVLAQNVYFNKRYHFDLYDVGYSIIQVDSGYAIINVSLDYNLTGGQNTRTNFILLDSTGNVVWQKVYADPLAHYYGGGPGSLIKTSDGGFALGGGFADTSGNNNGLLYRFNSEGDTLWTRQFGDSSLQFAYQCKQTFDGGFVLAGVTETYDTDGDPWLIKTDSVGNLLWEKHYGSNQTDYVTSVCQTSDSGFLMAGMAWLGSHYNGYVIKTDSLGNQKWVRYYGGPYCDYFWSCLQTSDGGLVMCGAYTLYDPLPACQVAFSKPYMVKVDTAGTLIWQKTFGDSLYDQGLKVIRELNDGSLIGTGMITDSTTFYKGTVLKTDWQGNLHWLGSYENLMAFSSKNFLNDISPTNDGGFVAVGWLMPNSPDTGTQDIWVLKIDSLGCEYSGCPLSIKETETEDIFFRIFPNPTDGNFKISYLLPQNQSGTFEMFDVNGRKVYSQVLRKWSTMHVVKLPEVANGVYSCVITTGEEKATRKLIMIQEY